MCLVSLNFYTKHTIISSENIPSSSVNLNRDTCYLSVISQYTSTQFTKSKKISFPRLSSHLLPILLSVISFFIVDLPLRRLRSFSITVIENSSVLLLLLLFFPSNRFVQSLIFMCKRSQ